MKTLHLLRHAKSSWDAAGLADHDRPLAPRGRKAAPRVGRALRERGVHPDRVLCSTARRAVDTLDAVLSALGGDAIPVEREHGLYLCGSNMLLERVRDLPDAVASAMLVAHNPDLHALAALLAGAGDADALAALAAKFPTGACATIVFETAHWQGVAPGTGCLTHLVLPRTLA